jgi:hypothetical protein
MAAGARPEVSCDRCGGTGKRRLTRPPSGESWRIGDVVVEDGGGSSTAACDCVRDLPAIDGMATWWESETIHHVVVPVPIFDDAVEITAECEVPRRADGQRVHRTAENAYYPPLITVESPERITLDSEDARALAAALAAAADACDRADALAAETNGRPASA